MRHEKSAGFIVFRKTKAGPEYLLLQNSSRFFWDFPKGNIAEGESEENAAMRELEEEAGIKKIKTVPGFRDRSEYFYTFEGEKIHKIVFMLLAEIGKGEEVKLSWEHSDYRWVDSHTAKKMLKDKKKLAIENAEKFLSSRLSNWTKKAQ